MRSFILYLSLALPLFASGEVASLRAVLEEDLKVHIKTNELKKEHRQSCAEIELAMQNAKALISVYEQKTEQLIVKNKEQNFKANATLAKINSLEQNISKLEANTAKLYSTFVQNLDRISPSLREVYKAEVLELENTSYPNSSEETLAKLKLLNKLAQDANGYKFMGKNTVVFGLNTEFDRRGAEGDVLKLFEILDGERGYEVLELKVEKGVK